jgi:DNA-binding transcriptional LysR family regulator
LEDLTAHELIGYDRSDGIIAGLARAGIKINRSSFKVRSDNHLVLWEALRAGAGISFAQAPLVASDPDGSKLASRIWSFPGLRPI